MALTISVLQKSYKNKNKKVLKNEQHIKKRCTFATF